MIAVIIAGGMGTRLWPLSTAEYPKHLLQLNDQKSLLQNTYERAHLVADEIFIISEASHVKHVYKQLADLPKDHVIVEPARRGTASCAIAALAKIKQKHAEDEDIVFMHADQFIRDTGGFVDTVKRAVAFASKYQKIVLLGLEPTHAATGFGYIERGDSADGTVAIYNVKSFKEKPDHRTAESYLAKGTYLWNMGFFVASLGVFEASLQKAAPDLWQNYQKLVAATTEEERTNQYLSFENEPIDTALIEKLDELLVTPGTFDWMDIGSFPDVHQVSPQDENGNTVQGNAHLEAVTDSLIRNDTDVAMVVIGVDNIAVVATAGGILVTSKSHAQKVGEVSKRFHKQ